jgi:lipoprotein signal peptidase
VVSGEQSARRRILVLASLAAIALSDQGVKWWAWRHASGVRINDGGDLLVPPSVGSMYSGRLTGGLLDLIDSGLLFVAVVLFSRRRRSVLVSVFGVSIIGGWGSNLLDRLAMHYWTAPGSVRGVVDFIPIDQHYYNVADMFIVAGTPLFVLVAGVSALRRFAAKGLPVSANLTATRFRPPRLRSAVLAATGVAVLTAAVGVGAADFGVATAPVTSASISYVGERR